MSDILSKEELKAFAEHPFFHDKIELLEKLKTRTRELLAMYVPMHSINIHSLRHYISLLSEGGPNSYGLLIKVTSSIVNTTNNKSITCSTMQGFSDYELEYFKHADGGYAGEHFDMIMMEKFKELSGAIISFSNRETEEEVYGA